jgi:hypothetical protein
MQVHQRTDKAGTAMSEEPGSDPLFEALQSVASSMGHLASEISGLVTSTSHMEEQRKRNFRVILGFSAIVSMALILLSGLFITVQHSASDIRSCVTPSGVCYRQQQARADKATAQLSQVANNNRYFTLVTVECQLGTPTVKEFRACVLEKVGPAIYPTTPK